MTFIGEPQVYQRPPRYSPTLGLSDLIKKLSRLLPFIPREEVRLVPTHWGGKSWAAAPISGLGPPTWPCPWLWREDPLPSYRPGELRSAGPRGVGVGDRTAQKAHRWPLVTA